MCGIAGFIGSSLSQGEIPSVIRNMVRAIAHRGPEEAGFVLDDEIALGAVRLALIDPLGGHQPMGFSDSRYWLAFNGEIFNYLELQSELKSKGIVFRTKSDTEVLGAALAAYGSAALPMLNGQFGFAFYDRYKKRLLLARDRAGERPVFFSTAFGGLIFGSEVKALAAHPSVQLELDRTALAQTARAWTPIPPRTSFRGISLLPPGWFCEFSDGKLSTSPFWQPPFHKDSSRLKAEDLSAALQSRFDESVRLRLRSDYPLSASISGGIDSAVVAAAALAQSSESFPTFSVRVDNEHTDEGPAQLRVLETLKCTNHTTRVDSEDVRDLFPQLVFLSEMPLFRSGGVGTFRLTQTVHEHGLRVMLTGDGADEMFCGYDIAKEAAFAERYSSFDSDSMREDFVSDLFHDVTLSKKFDAKSLLQHYGSANRHRGATLGAHFRRFANEPGLSAFGRVAEDDEPWEETIEMDLLRLDPLLSSRDLVDRARVIDYFTLMSGYCLAAQGDRPGAFNAVESRAPFLDPGIIDLAFCSSPADLLGGGRLDKQHVRDLGAPYFPVDVLSRRKQAMRIPGSTALLPGRHDWVDEALAYAKAGSSATVDPAKAASLESVMLTTSDAPSADSHAYCLMLSVVLLEWLAASRFEQSAAAVATPPMREIDLRTSGGHAERALSRGL